MRKNVTKFPHVLSFFSIVLCFCFFMNSTIEVKGAIIIPVISNLSEENSNTEDNSTTPKNSEITSVIEESSSNTSSTADLEGKEAGDFLDTDESNSEVIETYSTEEISPTVIDESITIRIDSYSNLRSLLTGSMKPGKIVLTNDISSDGSGITVNSSWTEVMIDGKDPDTGVIHTYSEARSNNNINQNIYISNSATTSVTLKNMNIIGYNYYGTVAVAGNISTTMLVYENVTYEGPQMTYNQTGPARYIDCNITIAAKNGSSGAEEVGELGNLEIGGETTINSTSGSSAFATAGTNPSFTVLEGANVTINLPNTFLQRRSNGVYATLEVENNAKLYITSAYGIDNGYFMDSVTIGENSVFSLVKTSNWGNSSLGIRSSLTVGKNSSFIIQQQAGGGSVVSFSNNNATAQFSSPDKVNLETINGGNVMRFNGGNGTIKITTQAMNIWKTLNSTVTDSFDTMPSNIWNQSDGSEFSVTATMNGANTTNVSTTWDGKTNQWNSALNTSTFTPGNLSNLVFGTYYLNISESLTPETSAVKGLTNPNSQVGVFYNSTKNVSAADTNGDFSVPVDFSSLPNQYSLFVMSSHDKLKAYQPYSIIKNGELKFASVPNSLPFAVGKIPSEPSYLKRSNTEWEISVEDTRGKDSTWRLDASLPENNISDYSGNILDGTIKFLENDVPKALTSSPITIYNGVTGSSPTTSISWEEDQGILVWLNSISQILPNTKYKTTIEWSLISAP